MFTLEIKFRIKHSSKIKKVFSKFYAKPYKGKPVFSFFIDYAKQFKTIGSAKGTYTKFNKKFNNPEIEITGYNIL